MNNSDNIRNKSYKKDPIQEIVLEIMNRTLYSKEIELIDKFSKPILPVIFIVGAQRSGTTLLMQLMTQYFELSYPNNFIARYWNVPYFGAMLYKNMLNNLVKNQMDFNSDLGYTKGLNGPHEFGYFWKKWFPWESWEEKKYNEVDYSILQKQLAAWENIERRPLLFKNIIQLDSNILQLKRLFPNAFFIFIKRDLIYNVQSTYKSRIKLFGNAEEWFGVKPSNYNSLKTLRIIEQITKQIVSTNAEIDDQLARIDSNSYIEVKYEDLVQDKTNILQKIELKFPEFAKIQPTKIEAHSLINENILKVENNIFKEIEDYCKDFI
jgi:hypothetical protein